MPSGYQTDSHLVVRTGHKSIEKYWGGGTSLCFMGNNQTNSIQDVIFYTRMKSTRFTAENAFDRNQYPISSFKHRGVYLILGLLNAAFISKIKTKENKIMCQFKAISYFLNHAV